MPTCIKEDITTIDKTSFDYIFEKNVTVRLNSVGGFIRCNVYRPKNVEKAPVIMTYGPYGEDTPTKE